MGTRDILTLGIAALGAVVALGSLLQASFEYVKRGRMERLQVFFDLRRRLKDPDLAEIAELVDEAKSRPSPKSQAAEKRLARIPLRSKRDYLGLFEEVGLALEEGLIEPAVANYMFGYYALHCADCDAFWVGVNRENLYWDRFYGFCEAMEVEHKRFERERDPARSRSPAPLPAAIEDLPNETSKPAVLLKIPPVLRPKTGSEAEVQVNAATVGEALEALATRFPDLRWSVFCKRSDLESKAPAVNRYLNVYYCDEDIQALDDLDTVVEDDGSITLLPASSGG